MSPLTFNVLGPLEVREGDRSITPAGQTPRMLLAALLLNANQVVSADDLIEMLWSEPPPSAQNALQVHISRLRKHLSDNDGGSDILLTRRPGYMALVEGTSLDSISFEQLAHEGSQAMANNAPAIAATTLRQALELWRGPLLADIRFAPFVDTEAQRWEEVRLAVLEDRLEADLQLGRHAELVGELRSLCAEHPYRERFRAQLMLALYRSGRQADALHEYQETRQSHLADLGVEPSASLQSLQSLILQQDPSLEVAVRQRQNVYRIDPATGTLPLIGRDSEIAALDDALRLASRGEQVLVTLEAASGLGKTRLLEEWLGGLDHTSLDVRRASAFRGRGSFSGDLAARLRLIQDPPEEHVGTTVLVLDDSQWADNMSLGVLAEVIATGTSGGSLLIILAHRPVSGLQRIPFDRLIERMHSREQVHLRLDVLNASDLGALVDSEDPMGASEILVRATGGVPFQLQRVVSELVLANIAAIQEGNIKVANGFGEEDVPLWQDAYGTLNDDERRIVQAVCMAGAPVSSEVAARITGADLGSTESVLSSPSVRRYITRSAEGWLPVHDLTAAKIVEVIDAKERQKVSRDLAGAVLEGNDAEDRRALAGTYLLEAGLFEEALPHLAAAAVRLIDNSAFLDALPLIDAALLALARSKPNAALDRQLRLARAMAYDHCGLMDLALNEFQQLVEPGEKELLDTLRLEAFLTLDRREMRMGEALIALAESQASRIGDHALHAVAMAQHASTLAGLGFVGEADFLSERSTSILSLHADDVQRYEGSFWNSHVPIWRGDVRAAEEATRRCVHTARTLGDTVLADILRWWALNLFFIGHVREGMDACDEGCRIGDRLGAAITCLSQSNRAWGLTHCGFFSEALAVADEELKSFLSLLPTYEMLPRCNRAGALLGLGRIAEAQDELENSLLATPPRGDGWYHRIRCEVIGIGIAAALGNTWDQAGSTRLTEELLSTRHLLLAAELLALRARAEGDRELARQSAQIALDIGAPMVGGRAALAGDLWPEPLGRLAAYRLQKMRPHIPASLLPTWVALPEVTPALELVT